MVSLSIREHLLCLSLARQRLIYGYLRRLLLCLVALPLFLEVGVEGIALSQFVMGKAKLSKAHDQATPEALGSSAVAKIAGFLEAGLGGTMVSLRVKPGAKTTQIMNLEDVMTSASVVEQIEVQISAPAREGEANTAVVEFVSGLCGVSKGSCSLVRGHKARDKVVLVEIQQEKALEAIRERASNW